MGERRIVGPGKTSGYTYPARKERLVGSGIKHANILIRFARI